MSGTIDRLPVANATLQLVPDPGRTHSKEAAAIGLKPRWARSL